jgi:NADP-dependent aldehyde dehydrogenase
LPALNSTIADAYERGRAARRQAAPTDESLPPEASPAGGFWLIPTLVETTADELEGEMLEECFGPLVVVARYADQQALLAVIDRLPGSLTASIHASDHDDPGPIVALLQQRSGRLIWNGYPTGVAVAWAMHHGGPAPSTTNSLHTSVGPTAIRRFLRPVSWQDAPARFLPAEVRDGQSAIPRRVDGILEVPLAPA